MAQVSGHVEAAKSSLMQQKDIFKCSSYMLFISERYTRTKLHLLSAPSGHCLVMSVACTVKEAGVVCSVLVPNSFLVAVDMRKLER